MGAWITANSEEDEHKFDFDILDPSEIMARRRSSRKISW